MSLSDELLRRPTGLTRVREILSRLTVELRAGSAFLIDESGIPFAATGHMEFRFPSPLPETAGSVSNQAILKTLVGEQGDPKSSGFILHQVSPRALLVVYFEQPLTRKRRARVKARLAQVALELKEKLHVPPASAP